MTAARVTGSIARHAQLRRIDLADGADPFAVAAALGARPDSAVLSGRWCGGGMAIFADPALTATGSWAQVGHLLDRLPEVAAGPAFDGVPAIGGAIVTALGYRALDSASDQPVRLDFYDQVLRWRDGHWWIEQLWTADRDARLADLVMQCRQVVSRQMARPPATGPVSPPITAIELPDRAAHIAAVGECISRIAAGDLYLANVCTRLSARLGEEPARLWSRMAQELRPDYAALVRTPHALLACLSPELFLRTSGRMVSTAPIKGTRRRSADASIDASLKKALLESEKDRAENIMIVDLMRNDLGRVCDVGSVTVTDLLKVSAHTGVWHLVSSVAGILRSDVTTAQLIAATFPPGSVTGAPKIAAINVTAELESQPRELYTGAVGLISPIAGMEFAVTIRSLEIAGETITLGVGGGITADSDPAAEWDECLTKAAPLLRAAGVAFPPQAEPAAAG